MEVTLVVNGEPSMAAASLRRVHDCMKDVAFFFTYGVSVVNDGITVLIAHNKADRRLGTVTALQP